jgi:hypothetical protein
MKLSNKIRRVEEAARPLVTKDPLAKTELESRLNRLGIGRCHRTAKEPYTLAIWNVAAKVARSFEDGSEKSQR